MRELVLYKQHSTFHQSCLANLHYQHIRNSGTDHMMHGTVLPQRKGLGI